MTLEFIRKKFYVVYWTGYKQYRVNQKLALRPSYADYEAKVGFAKLFSNGAKLIKLEIHFRRRILVF